MSTFLTKYYGPHIAGHFTITTVPDSQYEEVNHWKDKVEDESVLYLEKFIGSGFKFTKDMWSGGVNEWPVIVVDFLRKRRQREKFSNHQKKWTTCQDPLRKYQVKGKVKLVKLLVHQGVAKVNGIILLMWKPSCIRLT